MIEYEFDDLDDQGGQVIKMIIRIMITMIIISNIITMLADFEMFLAQLVLSRVLYTPYHPEIPNPSHPT